MTTPPGLLAAALLFWGWQTDLLAVGALAGAVVESARLFRARWDFSQGDLDRIWNLCVVLFFGAAVYAFAANDGVGAFTSLVRESTLAERSEALNKGARSVLLFFQWLPMTFLPIVLAQVFGERDRMHWSTFSWWLRRQRRESTGLANKITGAGNSRGRRNRQRGETLLGRSSRITPYELRAMDHGSQNCPPESPHHGGSDPGSSGLNVLWPFFAICLFAASAANNRTLQFPIGLTFLASWALWNCRPRSASALPWGGCMLLVVALGWAGHEGLFLLRNTVQRFESNLLSRLASGIGFDSRESRTMLGAVGRLKLSGRIILRVESDQGQAPPSLLREASYTQFRGPYWTATRREFANILPDADETSWRLLQDEPPENASNEAGPDSSVPVREVSSPRQSGGGMPLQPADPRRVRRTQVHAKSEVVIAGFLKGGEGLLALPLGATRLEELPAFVLETNRLGAVRVASGPDFARFHAVYQESSSLDSPPDDDDLDIPAAEEPAIARVAEALNLGRVGAERAARAVSDFFTARFRYSTWLEDGNPAASNQTSLATFLLQNRAGHCEYFATAAVLLLRKAGIPARYAVGYSVQERKGRHWIVRARHAHAWCLAWMNGAWCDLDATPAGWSEVEDARASAWETFSDAWSRIWFGIAEWRWGKAEWKRSLIWLTLPLLILAGWRLLSQKQWRRAAQSKSAKRGSTAWPGMDSEFYRVERKFAELGLGRSPHETQFLWLQRIGRTGWTDAKELERLVRWHYCLRFDPKGLTPEERSAMDSAVSEWLIRSRGRAGKASRQMEYPAETHGQNSGRSVRSPSEPGSFTNS
ncbi:MAG: transglutaminase domain-containing protein [Verrucomicrobia bacterium]|nr:transglutaminase domain-containing protein [Verrucomicrobiota bacterium]